MDSAIYDFSGHLTASSDDLFDKHLEHLQANLALATHNLLLYTVWDCIYLFCQLLVGKRPCLEPFCIPFQLQTELSAHSLIN